MLSVSHNTLSLVIGIFSSKSNIKEYSISIFLISVHLRISPSKCTFLLCTFYWLTVLLLSTLKPRNGINTQAVMKKKRIVSALAFLDSTRNIGIASPNFMNLVPSGLPNFCQLSKASGSVRVVYADWIFLKMVSASASWFLSGWYLIDNFFHTFLNCFKSVDCSTVTPKISYGSNLAGFFSRS